MKKLGILLLACITALNLWAEEFKIGKFTFKTITPTTVELICEDADITNVFLSEKIDYKGNSYPLEYWRVCVQGLQIADFGDYSKKRKEDWIGGVSFAY